MAERDEWTSYRLGLLACLAGAVVLSLGGSSHAQTCTPTPPALHCYPGFTYPVPTARPYISLAHYTSVNRSSTPYTRFKAAADAARAGSPPYAYSATHSVIMYALALVSPPATPSATAYIDDAIARVEAFVAAAEVEIAAGRRPELSNASYLDVGFFIEDLALTYDWGYSRLTTAQRTRWAALADQSLFNIWNPDSARWGAVAHPWSGWSIDNPGNNYHFSFLRATKLWAWASQNSTWLNFLKTQKFPPFVTYYSLQRGGGSREGTGYGTSMRMLFLNYLYWVDSTTENLAGLTPHARETIDYWVHATVPTLDRFAPIGDQARESLPELYDYQEHVVQYASALSPGTPEAKRGAWWLQNNSVNGVAHSFNLHGDLLTLADAPQAPTDLFYHASGVGALFARSSWNTNATWLSIVAGKYDESHAHQDQGSFTLFRNDWLAVTQNIWSRSGINQEVNVHNVVRFEQSNGTTIPQAESPTLASTMTPTSSAGVLTVNTNLTNAYWRQTAFIQNWARTFVFSGNTLRVTDVCTVTTGVRPVFQVQVPTQPVILGTTVVAGGLTITPRQPGLTVTSTAMTPSEFSKGYRVDFRGASGTGCSLFDFDLTTSPAPVVTTPTSASVTMTGATLGGNVTSAGSSAVLERGVVYSLTATNANPVIGGTGVTKSTVSGTTGLFTSAVTGLTPVSGYSYRAFATNSQETGYTEVATFTTLPNLPGPPTIGTATAGNGTVTVAFTAPVNNGGSPITSYTAACGTKTGTGASSPITVSGLTNGTAVTCTVVATNPAGNSPPSAASNSVTPGFTGTSIPRLVNISTRGQVGTGDNVLIGGFIIGSGTPKKVIIKGRGPSMASLGVPGTLADPAIRLFSGATATDFNDDWTSAANASEITASGQAPTHAKEAAILTTVNPGGAYTVHVTGVGATTGIAIVEVFELDKPEVPLLNISTRGPVLSGDHVMIGGFIIQGDAAQQVLIIAKGPSLGQAPFNVPGSLPDPTLDLYQAGVPAPIESNDNWVDSPNMAAIQSSGNAPSSPLESAIIRTLGPGAYTAMVKGQGAFQGIGLVEVYKK